VRNVTVTLDDETARWVRLEAARRDTSMSRLIGQLLRDRMADDDRYERALRSYLERPTVAMSSAGGSYPSRDELYNR